LSLGAISFKRLIAKMQEKTQRKMLALACAVIFTDMLGYGIIIPILPLYAESLGASEGQIGFLFASYAIALLLTLLPFGLVADLYGRKRLIVVGMFLLGCSSILFATSYSLSQLIASRLLQGLSASCTWAAALPLAASATSAAKRGIEMSALTIAVGLGTILGPIIGGLGSRQTPFYLCAALAFALSFLSLIYLKEIEIQRGYAGLKQKLTRILRNSGVRAACIGIFALYFALGMFDVLFPLHIASCQYQRVMVGLLFGVFGFSFIALQPAIGIWSDKIGRAIPLALGLLLAAVVIPFPFYFASIAPWVLLLLFLGLAGALAFTPTYPLIADSVAPNDQGVAYALNSSIYAVGYMLGPWLGGVLAGIAGMKVPFFLCSAILAAGAFGTFLVARRTP
jgi:MFS family permease